MRTSPATVRCDRLIPAPSELTNGNSYSRNSVERFRSCSALSGITQVQAFAEFIERCRSHLIADLGHDVCQFLRGAPTELVR